LRDAEKIVEQKICQTEVRNDRSKNKNKSEIKIFKLEENVK